MSKKITTSIKTPTGDSFTNMIVDIDNASINISPETTEGVTEYVLKAKVKVYTSQANLAADSKEAFVENVIIRSTNIDDVKTDPYMSIETELDKKYTFA